MSQTTFSVPYGEGDTVFLTAPEALLKPVTVVEVLAETFVKVTDGTVTVTLRTTEALTREQAETRVAELQALIAEPA